MRLLYTHLPNIPLIIIWYTLPRFINNDWRGFSMTTIIRPILDTDPLNSTKHRLYSMFRPIQETKSKKSDVLAYVATPLLDYFVLDAIFSLDISIRAINAFASLLKAAYTWTMNQQDSDSVLDDETSIELADFFDNISYIASSIIAQIVNILLSTASLVTRPVASFVELMSADEDAELSSLPACAF